VIPEAAKVNIGVALQRPTGCAFLFRDLVYSISLALARTSGRGLAKNLKEGLPELDDTGRDIGELNLSMCEAGRLHASALSF
jgi:hypothetical protein